MTFAERVAGGPPVVLDGGLATLLEARGHDLSDDLWSARLLRDDPAAVAAAHREFVAAGAEVATSASYQASYEGWAGVGVDREEVDRLLLVSVRLARESGSPWVAASVGPYGAALADGSEYRGDYGLDVPALRAFHHDRLRVLADAGPDVLALETVPCLAEVEALLAELDGLGVPAWLSVTCRDGERLRSAEPAAAAFAMVAGVADVVAVGVNCTAPQHVTALARAGVAASGKPVVVYPNSGEQWDGVARRWTGRASFDDDDVGAWVAAGVRLVGGCCRVGPREVASIARSLEVGSSD